MGLVMVWIILVMGLVVDVVTFDEVFTTFVELVVSFYIRMLDLY